MEKGTLIAKYLHNDINIQYEDYVIRSENGSHFVDITSTILGNQGLSQTMHIEYSEDWIVRKALITPKIPNFEGNVTFDFVPELAVMTTKANGNVREDKYPIHPGKTPVLIVSGSLLIPFLWIRGYVRTQFVPQVVPLGSLMITNKQASTVGLEFEVNGIPIDYQINFDKDTGMLENCISQTQKIKIYRA
jgi:hypothetical protein